jgi:hypothetical protein
MGIDWITACAPTWERSWDRGREQLAQPELFQPHIPDVQRTFRVRSVNGHKFSVGMRYNLRLDGDSIVVYDGINHVATAPAPPPEIVKVIRESGFGHAVGCVTKVYPHSGSADMAVS